MLKYIYDAWGNHKVVDNNGNEITDTAHIGNINPYRYRGYYFDTETGLYYLKSRYYDPQTGRFISIDDISFADPDTINGLNLYAYCCNNPVMHIDPNGKGWIFNWLVTEWPKFFEFTEKGFVVLSWSLSIFRIEYQIDENNSIYFSPFGNISIYLGFNTENGIGFSVGVSAADLGYEGEYFGVGIQGLTYKIKAIFENGSFSYGYGAGWYGTSISINFIKIFKDIFGG